MENKSRCYACSYRASPLFGGGGPIPLFPFQVVRGKASLGLFLTVFGGFAYQVLTTLQTYHGYYPLFPFWGVQGGVPLEFPLFVESTGVNNL